MEIEEQPAGDGPYRDTVVKCKADSSRVKAGQRSEKSTYDPFAERNEAQYTTDRETLSHLLKASLGTGILSMPIAFMYSGLIAGVFATILTALICTHCSYVLVQCGHKLYYRTRCSKLSFAEIAEISFQIGPIWMRGLASIAKYLIDFCLFLTYFGACAVYIVIVAKNLEQVLEYWFGYQPALRVLIAFLLLPIILLSWIPNLKLLAPISMLANIFMTLGLAITFYYLLEDLPQISMRTYSTFSTLPSFFAITIFAMEAIGVVMPLENNMKTPRHLLGVCGILNKGMSVVTMVYILLGFVGYWRYGSSTKDSITLNLPVNEWPAQAVKMLIALAVYCTFGLQFYVCLDIVWEGIKHFFTEEHTKVVANYFVRTLLAASTVILAISVPTIAPFMGLIGAFCFSILGMIFPALIEVLTSWDDGLSIFQWMIWKNFAILVCGIAALLFGTSSALKDISILYSEELNRNTTLQAN